MKRLKFWQPICMMLMGIFLEILAVALAKNHGEKIVAILIFITGVMMLGLGSGQFTNYIRIKARKDDISVWGYALIATVSIISGLMIRFIIEGGL